MSHRGKRRGAQIWEQPNLKRCRKDVKSLSTDSTLQVAAPALWSHQDTRKPTMGPDRKQRRKQERVLKKMRKLAFKQGKPLPTAASIAQEKQEKASAARSVSQAVKKKKTAQRRSERKKRKKEEAAARKQQEQMAVQRQEDQLLHQLERQLGLHKRKRKGLPAAFTTDGLDYLLEVVDPDKQKSLYQMQVEGGDADDGSEPDSNSMEEGSEGEEEVDKNEEESDEESEEEVEHDEEEVKSESEDQEESDEEEKQDSDKEEEESDEEGETDEELGQSDEEEKTEIEDNDNSKSITQESCLKEDIYGRLRDIEGHPAEKGGTYIPPGKRQMLDCQDDRKKAHLLRLKRQLKGLLNRVSEANLAGVCHQMEALFRESSRAEGSEMLAGLFLEAGTSEDPVPERILAEQTCVLAVVHNNVGSQVGATVLELWAKQFEELYTRGGNYGSGKQMENLMVLLCHLYNFKVVHSVLMFDVISRLSNSFSARDVDLLLTTLKSVGPQLRKEEPEQLRKAILVIQDQAAAMDTESQDTSRVKFMLEILMAIRNNNLRKIPNYDPSHVEGLVKQLRPLSVGAGKGEGSLRVSLSDLLDADKNGRWWLVGSAWSGISKQEQQKAGVATQAGNMNADLLELARKQRMNTDVRRNIFCVLMTCEDYVEAFERLLQLGLGRQQEAEIIHVLLDLALQEQSFNPFYAYLAQKLCEYDRRFQMMVQTSVRGRLSGEGVKLDIRQTQHLGRLLDHLITARASSLALLKVLDFGALDRLQVRLLKCLLRHLLLDHDEDTMCSIFSHIVESPKLQHLRDGLKLFMTHFLLRRLPGDVSQDSKLLQQRVTLAQKALTPVHSRLAL